MRFQALRQGACLILHLSVTDKPSDQSAHNIAQLERGARRGPLGSELELVAFDHPAEQGPQEGIPGPPDPVQCGSAFEAVLARPEVLGDLVRELFGARRLKHENHSVVALIEIDELDRRL